MRLFVALNLSPSIIRLCSTIQDRIKLLYTNKELQKINFIPSRRLHITLRPPIAVDQENLYVLIEKLNQVPFKPFGLCTNKLSFFHQTNILWLGIEKSEELIQLVTSIQKATYKAGYSPEKQDKKFMGHITLVRSIKSPLAQEGINTLNHQLPTQCSLVNEFVLKETIFNSDGQVIDYFDRQLFDHY